MIALSSLLTDQKAETQKGSVTHPRPHSSRGKANLSLPPPHTLHLPGLILLASFVLCFRSKFDPQDMDKNVNAIQTVSGILQGPFDLGNQLLGMKGVMEMMVALCGSEREADQLVAVEALIHASTKLSRATFIITNGVTLLKQIYKTTKNEKIKIRTLVVRKLGAQYQG